MMLFESSLPRSFWGYAILYTAHILNRVINQGASTKKTPYHLYIGSRPSVAHLRSFGCGAQVLLTGVKDKLAPRSVQGVFIGLSENKKAYIIHDRNTGKTHISRDVVFYEGGQVRPSEVHVTIPDSEESDEEIDITVNAGPDLKVSQNYRSKVLAENLPDSALEDSSTELAVEGPGAPAFNTPILVAVLNPPPPEVRRSARLKCQPIHDDDDHYQKSSYKHRESSRKSRTTTSGTIERGTEEIVKVTRAVGNESAKVANIDPDPLTYVEAMSCSDRAQWRAACAEEMEQFVHQNIFDMVSKPEGCKVVNCKWVFKTKLGPDGQVEHYKARLVAKGFSQVKGIDFNETYSPVVGHSTVRTLLALTCTNSWHIHQMDAKSAFLNGDLKEEIYMKIPPGQDRPEEHVWRLRKALYGLKQVSREWYTKVHKVMVGLGYKVSVADKYVFTRIDANGYLIIVAVYVDDLLFISKSLKFVESSKSEMSGHFEMKDLGLVKWILQMELNHDISNGITTLSQSQYIEEILERHGMANSQPVKTPMDPNTTLPSLAVPEIDVTEYQQCVGSLMHAMVWTRPDIAHAVGMVSRYATAPGQAHMTAVKRIFCYLQGTSDYKLTYRRDKAGELVVYSDSNWAGDKIDRKSTSGFVAMLNGGPVVWGLKKSLSSTEAEFIASTSATQELIWLRGLLSSINHLSRTATPLLIDNQGAISLIKNGLSSKHSKYIELRYYFICEKFTNGTIATKYISTDKQLADGLTKALAGIKYKKFVERLGFA